LAHPLCAGPDRRASGAGPSWRLDRVNAVAESFSPPSSESSSTLAPGQRGSGFDAPSSSTSRVGARPVGCTRRSATSAPPSTKPSTTTPTVKRHDQHSQPVRQTGSSPEVFARLPGRATFLDSDLMCSPIGVLLRRTSTKLTGIPFSRWRTPLRLQAALPAPVAGESGSAVARRVGYDTTSAFVVAVRRETGLTPAA